MENKKILNIFYPNDIDQVITGRDVQTVSTRFSFVISLSIVGNILLYFIVMKMLHGMEIDAGFLVGMSIVIFIDLVVLLPIFRKFVFKEDKLRKEHYLREQDNIARYYKIGQSASKEINIRVENKVMSVDIVSYDDGLSLVLLQIRYGSNTDKKAINNKKAFRELYRYLGENNLEFKVIVLNEDFSTSKELHTYMKKLNKSEYKDIGMVLLNQALEYAEFSNVETDYILIKTRNKSQEYNLNFVLAEVYNILTSATSFRSVEFLKYMDIKKFAEEYYGVEVIDLSKISSVTEDIKELKEFDTYVSLYTEDNKVEDNIETDGHIL